jgi:hypothetical protein
VATLIHLLLDLENVQPSADELEAIRGPRFRLWILHGPHQKNFTSDRVKAWQPLGEQLQFVQSAKAGRNALDMHIAFLLGEIVERDRASGQSARYVIVSADKDFDSLLEYAKSQQVALERVDSLQGIMARDDLSPEASRVLEALRAHPRNRPVRRDTLERHIRALLGNKDEPVVVNALIDELVSHGKVAFEGAKVLYPFAGKPDAPK